MKVEPNGKKYCPGHNNPHARMRVDRAVEAMINQGGSHNDPNGSYTGRPLDQFETPVQDADDL